jgi:hypothetical protein
MTQRLGVRMDQGDDHEHDSGRPIANTPESSSSETASGAENLADGFALDPKVQDQLGRVFRAYCDDLIHQPIPDKFSVLLAQLEAKQRSKNG